VPKDDDRYLEYWQFYVFNDWHNRHEADWELVVVLLAIAAVVVGRKPSSGEGSGT
jgi:hypothetical protein